MGEILLSPHPNGEIRLLLSNLKKPLPPRSYFEQYRQAPYARPEAAEGIHGDGHRLRVNILAHALHNLLSARGVETDIAALSGFASTHDLERQSDSDDREHGLRSARLVRDGGVWFIPTQSLKGVSYLNEWHVPDDRFAPVMTADLAAAKDSDALDRCRDPEEGLNESLLRFPESHLLIAPARILYQLGEYNRRRWGMDAYGSVLQAAVDLRLMPDR